MFSFEHLAAFCATVETGSYSQAARKLGKDRTTLREQVKALEDSYALTLFTIEGKKAQLTPAAKELYKQAKLLVINSQQLNNRMLNSYKQELSYFDIYHDVMLSPQRITRLDQMIVERLPNLRINWLHREREDVLQMIAVNHHHLALLQYRLVNLPQHSVRFINLASDEFACYCNPNFHLALTDTVELGELQLAKQFISEDHFNNMPELLAVSSNIRVISQPDVLLELLKRDGWAILSQEAAAPLLKRGELVKLNVHELIKALTLGFAFYYSAAIADSQEIATLVNILREEMASS
ncbi:LysR family transcriptional regulator [Vibrio ponticus]|uniref:LysR family transcriptional regulator n=1 Tax=Vibrio ponticus TaxID=265668 RepID=A0A3N3E5T9_9VIBR|nr:LysR family transcriptional regulator [Vibrio ponticus]ROV62096.1 LysR family transcriptional regulator [Vibrio ponticus]